MSRSKGNWDPWVQYTYVVNEFIANEEKRRDQWRRNHGDPVRARVCTFDRVVPSQAGSPWSNFREPTGVTRPNVDPLPHHYKFSQNWEVMKPHLADHEKVFSKPTRPRRKYDRAHVATYMSIPDITDKDDDFKAKAEHLRFSTKMDAGFVPQKPEVPPKSAGTKAMRQHVTDLMGTKARLLDEINKVDQELDSLAPSRAPSRLNTAASRKGGWRSQSRQASRLATPASRLPTAAPRTAASWLGDASRPETAQEGSFRIEHAEDGKDTMPPRTRSQSVSN